MERKLKSKEPDSRSINTDDEYTLEFWARELKITTKKLKAAVAIAGRAVPDVKRQLTK